MYKNNLKMSSAKWWPFCSGHKELKWCRGYTLHIATSRYSYGSDHDETLHTLQNVTGLLSGYVHSSIVIAFCFADIWARLVLVVSNYTIVKPVCNNHIYNKNYYLWFIQRCVLMKTEDTNLLLLTISALWSSSRWPPRWAPEGKEVSH